MVPRELARMVDIHVRLIRVDDDAAILLLLDDCPTVLEKEGTYPACIPLVIHLANHIALAVAVTHR
jgi:hypothetical protein